VVCFLRLDNIEQLDELQNARLMIEISHLLNDKVRWADTVGKLSKNPRQLFFRLLP